MYDWLTFVLFVFVSLCLCVFEFLYFCVEWNGCIPEIPNEANQVVVFGCMTRWPFFRSSSRIQTSSLFHSLSLSSHFHCICLCICLRICVSVCTWPFLLRSSSQIPTSSLFPPSLSSRSTYIISKGQENNPQGEGFSSALGSKSVWKNIFKEWALRSHFSKIHLFQPILKDSKETKELVSK